LPDIFLSYSRKDQVTARRFADALQREGFSVWWDQSLSAGQAFDRVTEKALDEAKAVVVLWSKHSVDSNWVRAEATQAQSNQRLVPVMIEACKRPIMFELTHTADLSGWTGDQTDSRWRSFIDGLRQFAQTATPASVAPTAHLPRASTGFRITWVAGALALLILGAVASWYWQNPGNSAQQINQNAEVSVAVLPFRDISLNKDQEYFADGVTEEILNALARVRGLSVTARTSSFAFKGKDVSLREVGKTLSVDHILEGSIRKDGETLRITAQLIVASRDAHLWSRSWERPLKDVFRVQEEIAKLVAETLSVSLGVGENARVPGMTRNVEAYEAFLAGRAAVRENTPESTERAIELLGRAVALDSSFALAWMALSSSYRDATILWANPSGKPWLVRSQEAFAESRRLAPDAYYVKFGLIAESMSTGSWGEVAKLYDEIETAAATQGLQLNLDSDRGMFMLAVGHAREAIPFLERARNRDPLNAASCAILGEAYANTGKLDAAFAEFDRVLVTQKNPRLYGTALYTALATRDRKVIEQRLDAMISSGSDNSGFTSAMKPLLDKPDQAVDELRRLAASATNSQVRAAFGTGAAYFGEARLAFELLRTPTLRNSTVELVRFWRPISREVRRLPEFKALVRELGLVDYWREFGWGDFCKPTTGDDFECT
jgi:TolB-like protein/tetratricopeptide (TPR) repeat protein